MGSARGEAARQLGFGDPDLLRVRGTDLQILEYYREKKGNFAELTNWLVREMEAPDAALKASPIHTALAGLDLCKVIYTTNYDDFIERALTLAGTNAVALANEAHFAEAHRTSRRRPADLRRVVKFHGDLKTPEVMVLSESEYEERLRLLTPMDAQLQSDLLGRAVLFVGYSFRDPNIAYLFHRVNEERAGLPESQYGRRAFIAIADPSDFERTLFKRRNIDVIPVRGTHQADDVAELLRDLAA